MLVTDWLRHVLLSGHFRRVCEIGCWKGFSTAALLDALEAGAVDAVHLCDSHPTGDLLAAVDRHPNRDRIAVYAMGSLDFLRQVPQLDFLFLDGNHSESNVRAELEYLLPLNLPLIAAHDVTSGGRYQTVTVQRSSGWSTRRPATCAVWTPFTGLGNGPREDS
jgi:predicted O-methyltransferase YrrM